MLKQRLSCVVDTHINTSIYTSINIYIQTHIASPLPGNKNSLRLFRSSARATLFRYAVCTAQTAAEDASLKPSRLRRTNTLTGFCLTCKRIQNYS